MNWLSERLHPLLRGVASAWLVPALSMQAAIVFNDTFEPDGAALATRNDDAGSGFGLGIQWRPRVSSQGGSGA